MNQAQQERHNRAHALATKHWNKLPEGKEFEPENARTLLQKRIADRIANRANSGVGTYVDSVFRSLPQVEGTQYKRHEVRSVSSDEKSRERRLKQWFKNVEADLARPCKD